MTKRRRPLPPPPPPPQRSGLPLPAALGLGALAVVVGVVVAMVTVNGEENPAAAPAEMTHIHALAIDPADGTLYAGTHNGVFRVSASGEAVRVGQTRQDMMGFVAAGAGRFLGSGHPAAGQGGPAHLGLIESTDSAQTWRSRSLQGDADFHCLLYRHDTVYGYNSTTGRLMVSTDLTGWQDRGEVALHYFAVSPDDADLLLGTTPHGLVGSADGGRTWAHLLDAPLVLLDWQRADRLWAVSATGETYLSPDGGNQWSRRGAAAGRPAALAADGDTLYLAMADGSILRSGDAAATWTTLRR